MATDTMSNMKVLALFVTIVAVMDIRPVIARKTPNIQTHSVVPTLVPPRGPLGNNDVNEYRLIKLH